MISVEVKIIADGVFLLRLYKCFRIFGWDLSWFDRTMHGVSVNEIVLQQINK